MKRWLYTMILCSGIFSKALALGDSLDIKIGQMIMVGMEGSSVSDTSSIILAIQDGLVGGILYFEYNISPTQSIATLQKLSSDLQKASAIPLFISIDQEGGKVNRLKTKYGFDPMPSANDVGKAQRDEYTREVGQTIAHSLSSCGINLNYAPVVDVYNPNCPVLGKVNRCYSDSVEQIAHMASIVIQEHHKQGVLCCIKHFPGHGNSQTDSHLGMTDVSLYWKPEELIPYQQLIKDQLADMVMVAHVVNNQLDSSGLPATLSKATVTHILRDSCHYNGVIITDDMQMHAISNYYGLEQSISKSINAGVDIVMFSNNIKGAKDYEPRNIHATIKRLVQNGEIPEARIHESYARIMALKKNLSITR